MNEQFCTAKSSHESLRISTTHTNISIVLIIHKYKYMHTLRIHMSDCCISTRNLYSSQSGVGWFSLSLFIQHYQKRILLTIWLP